MAINPGSTYPTKTAVDANYTYRKAQDVSSPDDGTGTPWIAPLINDVFGMQQALLDNAGIVPSNSSDTAVVSEYYQAIQRAIERQMERYTNTTIGAKSLSERIGGIRSGTDIDLPYSTANIVSGGPFRNVARGYNPVSRKETALFIVDDDETKIVQVENRNKDFVQVQTNLTITLAANHVPDSLCCDGDSVYILCHSAATGTAAIVYKFTWDGTPLTWNSTPVWSTALSAGIRDDRDGSSVIKVADSSRVVVLLNGDNLGVGIPALSVLNKSTGTETTGSGNHVAGGKIGGVGLAISSGHIWFTTQTAGDETYWINGAQIVNPTLAPTNYATPDSSTGVGALVGFMDSNGYMLALPRRDGKVNTYNTTDGNETKLALNTFSQPFGTADEYPPMVYDGYNFWTYFKSGSDNAFLLPLDLRFPMSTSEVQANSYTYTGYPWKAGVISGNARMCFADGCLWLIASANAAPNGINAQRIPRLTLRY
jgi:hypothetical protein